MKVNSSVIASYRFGGDPPVKKPVMVQVLKRMTPTEKNRFMMRLLSNRLNRFPSLTQPGVIQRIILSAKPVKSQSPKVSAAQVQYGGHRYVFEKWPDPKPHHTFYRIHELDDQGNAKAQLTLPDNGKKMSWSNPGLEFEHTLPATFSYAAKTGIAALRDHLDTLSQSGLFNPFWMN